MEDIPLPDESVDVIMSNCVINLSGDKEKAFSEAYRVLRKGGRLAIADIVTLKEIPAEIRKMAEVWAGCLGGALKINTFKEMLEKTGFKDVQIDPVHIYSKSILQNLLQGHKELNELLGKLDLDAIDGAFAGAHIKAFKE
ncbi:MAG: methyltransferase domain-containing protein [Desulfotomaculaceae bacterium]